MGYKGHFVVFTQDELVLKDLFRKCNLDRHLFPKKRDNVESFIYYPNLVSRGAHCTLCILIFRQLVYKSLENMLTNLLILQMDHNLISTFILIINQRRIREKKSSVDLPFSYKPKNIYFNC